MNLKKMFVLIVIGLVKVSEWISFFSDGAASGCLIILGKGSAPWDEIRIRSLPLGLFLLLEIRQRESKRSRFFKMMNTVPFMSFYAPPNGGVCLLLQSKIRTTFFNLINFQTFKPIKT